MRKAKSNISWALAEWRTIRSAKQLFLGLRHDAFYLLVSDWRPREIELVGNTQNGCFFGVDFGRLGEASTIISAGAGTDISFELELVRRTQAKVHLLDPSETGVTTMQDSRNQHPRIVFHPSALAGSDGAIYLNPPLDVEEGSWSLANDSAGAVQVPAISLRTLCEQNDIARIDLLKMDIEGAEYQVIDSMLRNPIPAIGQLAVEFHNGVLPGIRRSQTLSSIWKLWRSGFRLVHKDGSNHTFVNSRIH